MSSSFPHTDRPIAPKKKNRSFRFILVLFLLALAFSGGYFLAKGEIKPEVIFKPKRFDRPYLAYQDRLLEAGLDSLPLGQSWIAAGKAALEDSAVFNLPVQSHHYFAADQSMALTIRFTATEGELLRLQLTDLKGDEGQLFIEIFRENRSGKGYRTVSSTVFVAGEIEYEIERTSTYLLRIQPELLMTISFQLMCYKAPSLAFPVQGKDRKAILSFFGAPRDGGRRKHKGVDIFANKGTPILAAADGRVSLRNGGLGGKTVWQRTGNKSLYYAHMDSQYVRSGQMARIGDTLGTVGNTGNAKYTPSHLHFGIYRRGFGAVDPLAFIDTNLKRPQEKEWKSFVGQWVRTKKKDAKAHQAPDSKSIFLKLKKAEALKVCADFDTWVQVEMMNKKHFFIQKRELESLDDALFTQKIEQEMPLLADVDSCAAMIRAVSYGDFQIMAMHGDYYLAKSPTGLGWLRK